MQVLTLGCFYIEYKNSRPFTQPEYIFLNVLSCLFFCIPPSLAL